MRKENKATKKEDLEAALDQLEEDLKDLEETMGFNFSLTSAHIGGAQSERTRKR